MEKKIRLLIQMGMSFEEAYQFVNEIWEASKISNEDRKTEVYLKDYIMEFELEDLKILAKHTRETRIQNTQDALLALRTMRV